MNASPEVKKVILGVTKALVKVKSQISKYSQTVTLQYIKLHCEIKLIKNL